MSEVTIGKILVASRETPQELRHAIAQINRAIQVLAAAVNDLETRVVALEIP